MASGVSGRGLCGGAGPELCREKEEDAGHEVCCGQRSQDIMDGSQCCDVMLALGSELGGLGVVDEDLKVTVRVRVPFEALRSGRACGQGTTSAIG